MGDSDFKNEDSISTEHRQDASYIDLVEAFKASWGVLPEVLARAPGRVNLIGEHIDYMGYGVLPMAIGKEAVIAAGRLSHEEGIVCASTDPSRFPQRHLSTDRDAERWREPEPEGGVEKGRVDWIHYVQCGLRAFLWSLPTDELSRARQRLEGVGLMIHGSIPPSAGLSSSSALVVVSCMAVAHLAGHRLGRTTLARLCVEAERWVGTAGGGMDQSVCCLAREGAGMYITFDPLHAAPVTLPQGAVFVVANSLVSSSKAVSAHTHFNKRVVECRLAAALIAENLGLVDRGHRAATTGGREGGEGQRFRTIRQLEEALQDHPKGPLTPALVSQVLHAEPYSLASLTSILCPASPPQVEVLVERQVEHQVEHQVEDGALEYLIRAFFPDRTDAARGVLMANDSFSLCQRALHVLREAARVREFQSICDGAAESDVSEGPEGPLTQLGRLMDASHADCCDLYDCSCPELDVLTQVCREAGALGSRLTGAGWGGCCVSLVPSARVPAFLEKVRRLYFLPLLQHTSMPENTSETSLLDQSSAASDGVPEAEGKCTLVEGGETFLFVTIPSRGASYLEVTQDWHV